MKFWKKKKSSVSVAGILLEKSGQDAIIEIDNLLSGIFYENPNALSPEEKDVVLIEELERGIHNGGFHQYFFNSSGGYYADTVQALERIKSVQFLGILKNAGAPFPNSLVPDDLNERQNVLETIEEDAEELWGRLEQEFYRYEEIIYELLISYIKDHSEQFR